MVKELADGRPQVVSDANPGAGAALERAIRHDLPQGVELDPREEALLSAAVRQADDIEALEADIRERGRVLDGGALNPSVREVRQGRTALGRLLAGIEIPASASPKTQRAERAARARWTRAF
jgi:hypothetical protein